MKFKSKSKLSFKDGYMVTKKGKVVFLPEGVYYQLMRLELIAQKCAYLDAQGKGKPAPSLEGFERESMFGGTYTVREDLTPLLDRKIEETKQLLDEIDKAEKAEKITAIMKQYSKLLDFIESDEFIPGGYHPPIDIPFFQDPLKIDKDLSQGLINRMVQWEFDVIIAEDDKDTARDINRKAWEAMRIFVDKDGDR